MEIVCPHCKHADVDDWEMLDVGMNGPMTCEACSQVFQMLVWECEGCEDEVASTWIGEVHSLQDLKTLHALQCSVRCTP